MKKITIEVIDDKSPHLETVIHLGDANKDTLGFFPKGAFENKASKELIIVALNEDKKCIGYLMYQIVKKIDKIKVLHLCIDEQYRGKGITKKLTDFLKSRTKNSRGIYLECRRDYQIDRMWEKLGFIPQHERQAKTKNKTLTYWYFDHGHSDLFSFAYEQKLKSELCVIIDFNIFQKLYKEDNNENDSKSSLLLADSLDSSINLYVTDEFFNNINNIGSKQIRNEFTKYADCLPRVDYSRDRFEKHYTDVVNFAQSYQLNLSQYELKHLTKAVASDIIIFITNDQSLLNIANEFYDQFRLSIKSIEQLIIQLDDLIDDKQSYQPIRLAGTWLQESQLHIGQEKDLGDIFRNQSKETIALFQQQIRYFLTESKHFECSLISQDDQPIALIVFRRANNYQLEIPMLRIKDCDIAPTLATHLIYLAISRSVKENRQFTMITDDFLQNIIVKAIQEDHFDYINNSCYIRANISIIDTRQNIQKYIINLASKLPNKYDRIIRIAESLTTSLDEYDYKTFLNFESILFPAKIIDVDIPTFIVPIKPYWASQLFDEQLANQTLFGAMKIKVALNREAVYYKSKRGAKELKPGITGRILWYVSNNQPKGRGFYQVSCIRACSRLDEVIIDKPEYLYYRFRDLGIYNFDRILEVAQKEYNQEIMALKFSNTEIFNSPVFLDKIREVLNNQNSIQSATFVNRDFFAKIYKSGTKK